MPLTVCLLLFSYSAEDDLHNGNVLSTVGDNRCRWNLSALLKLTGLKREDVLFAQFQPEVMLHCGVPLCMILFVNGSKKLHLH